MNQYFATLVSKVIVLLYQAVFNYWRAKLTANFYFNGYIIVLKEVKYFILRISG